MERLSRSAARVQEALASGGFPGKVVELPDSTRTAAEAAEALGTTTSRIVKSLVFRGASSGRPYLVLASGAKRVDAVKVSALVGEPVALADPTFVRERTGFSIGGVPPLGHAEPLETLIDRALLEMDEAWAAAGTPRAVFRLEPRRLVEMTGGRSAEVGA